MSNFPPSRRFVLRLATLGVGLAAVVAAGAPDARAAEPAAAAAARAAVEGFHAKLIGVMKKAKELGLQGRFEELRPEVAKRFNLKLMMAIATGNAWNKMSPDEQERLTESFGRFSTANYASRFDSWSGHSFETVNVAKGPRGTMMVVTRLNRPNDKPVGLTYVTRAAKNEWQIVDVLVDAGISELAVRRSEYSAVLARGGVSALIAEIASRTKKLLES